MQDKLALKIGTRGSPLALYQARLVQRLLGEAENVPQSARDEAFPIVILKTTGDRLTDRRLIEAGGKGLFTRELEEALISGQVDLAVHSMKDVPTHGQAPLSICAVLPRADIRDSFISLKAKGLLDLPQGAVIGTASIRRQAQTLAVRPDIQFTLLRGNVGTRLKKLQAGDCDATFLAAAGLQRLEMDHVITELIETDIMLPAPAQGAIGIEIKTERSDVAERLSPLNHKPTQIAITAERAFLRALDGSCRTPIAALAQIHGKTLSFRGQVFTPRGNDGHMGHYRRETQITLGADPVDDAYALGIAMGTDIRSEAGDRLKWDIV